MRYCGGKNRSARIISEIINGFRGHHKVYEPFCGGLSVTAKLLPDYASDGYAPLIGMYIAHQHGWRPPESMTEDEYHELKGTTTPEGVFASFGLSFGGKFCGGFARSGDRDYCKNAYNSLNKKMAAIEGKVEFLFGGYDEIEYEPNTILYCDPPYAGTTQAYGVKGFNSSMFWEWCEAKSRDHIIFVSEFTAPDFVKEYTRFERRVDMRKADGSKSEVEKLYILGDG